MTPKLIVTVDVEEIFDWDEFDRSSIEVPRTAELSRFQDLCHNFGLKPIYFITYPMLDEHALTSDLARYYKAGECELGVHIHTWTTPPYLDRYDQASSYQGNLTHEMEEAKIASTLKKFSDVFGFAAPYHRAGRFGCGKNTFSIIQKFGIQHDFSPSAKFDFSTQRGPNYSRLGSEPFLDLETDTICFPVTGTHFFPGPDQGTLVLDRLRLGGLVKRLIGSQVVRLTTEGNDAARLEVLTKLARGQSVETFVFTVHTTSFFENGNQYAASRETVENLFDQTRLYFDFFTNDLGGANGDPRTYTTDTLRQLNFSDHL